MSATENPTRLLPLVVVESLALADRIKERHPEPLEREEAQDALVHLAEFVRDGDAENDALRGIADYAKHSYGCARTRTSGGLFAPGKCDCGLEDLREKWKDATGSC